MKNKELLAVLAVSTIATNVLTGCGQAAQIDTESVSETSISSDTISDDTVSDDSISEETVSDDSISEETVSEDSVSDEIEEELDDTSDDITTSEDDGLHDANGNFKLDDWWLTELKRLGATDDEIASVKSEKQLETLVNRLYSEGRTEDTRCDSCYDGCYTPTCDTECFTCDECDSCDNCFSDNSCYTALCDVGCNAFQWG